MQRTVLLSSVVVVFVAYFTLSTATTMLGGAKEAKIDSHTEDVAKFAVTQLNAKANFPIQGTLKLGRIVSAKTQVCIPPAKLKKGTQLGLLSAAVAPCAAVACCVHEL